MANPFKTKATVTPETAELATTRRVMRWNIVNSKKAVTASHEGLVTAENLVNSFSGEVPEAAQNLYNSSAREFNMATKRLAYSHGKLGASIEGMFKSFADTLGMDTAKWGSTKIKGDAGQAWLRASEIKGNVIERIISKPFRVAASFPKLSLIGVGIAGVMGIGGVMHRRAAAQTQQDAIQQASAIEAQAQQAQLQQFQQLQALQQQQQQPNVNVTVQPQPAPQINAASPKIQAGNDNVQYQGTVQTPQLAASL